MKLKAHEQLFQSTGHRNVAGGSSCRDPRSTVQAVSSMPYHKAGSGVRQGWTEASANYPRMLEALE